MEFHLLGPVELWAHGGQIELRSTKVKQLLAALLWTPGEIVSKFTLISRLWDEDAPPSEMASLHANVSRLRKSLEQCGEPDLRLEHIHLGYRLTAPAECVDVHRFKRCVGMAEAAVGQGDLDDAVRLLRSAEGLVHGEVLAGLPGNWARERRGVLEEEIHTATLRRIELQLTVHPEQARDLLPELHGLAVKNEFDEPALELRLQALHLANRTSEALHAYTAYRERLRESSGLSPGLALQAVYTRLLQTEPRRTAVAASSPVTLTTRRPTTEPPNTLAVDPAGFVGRRADVEAITARIDSQLASGASVICVIDGMPAIGKSSLALYLAHRLKNRCPDGAIQLHLRGHDESLRPTNTESALDVLLRTLGVEPVHIQHASGLEHSIALWRRSSAGKRLLLFLDDAAEGEQVLPLIPNGEGSIVLVTARNRLHGLPPDVVYHALAPMTDDDAKELFIRSARMARTTDPALRDVVAACGGFPMALCLAGSALHFRSSWNIADLADDLANTRGTHQLDSIIAPAVYRSVATSYRDLPDLQRKLLRRLSLNPGSRIHLSAATALTDASPFETQTALYNLVDQSLVEEPTRRFYQLHDMIKLFATHACETEEDPEDLKETADRLTNHILGKADRAARLFHPHRHVSPGEARTQSAADDYGFADARQATAWLDEEQGWLRAVAEHWFANGRPRDAGLLVHLIAKFLERRNLWKESVALHQRALQVWHEYGDQIGEAHALIDIAAAQWRLGSFETAVASASKAMRIWSDLGDTGGQADALLQLGRVNATQHKHAEAIANFEECLALHLERRDQHGRAVALQHLGIALFESSRHQAGIERTLQALDIAREINEVNVETYCINNLGEFYSRVGDYASAEPYFQQALPKVQEHGERHGTAIVALNLGDCHTRLHRPEVALPLLERALDLFQRDDNAHGVMLVLIAQARAHLGLRRSRSARELLDRAIITAERSKDSRPVANICLINGDIYTASQDESSAALAYGQALRYARKADAKLLQAVAFHRLGDNAERRGDASAAHTYWLEAIRLYGDAYANEVSMLWERMTQEDAA